MLPKWIVFLDCDDRSPAATLNLESTEGFKVNTRQYRDRYNQVLYFPPDEGAGVSSLSEIGSRHIEYDMENTRVLVLLPKKVGHDAVPDGYPFPVLMDINGIARKRFLALLPEGEAPRSFVFILDRYGVPYAVALDSDLRNEGVHDEIMGWLGFIGLQCPE